MQMRHVLALAAVLAIVACERSSDAPTQSQAPAGPVPAAPATPGPPPQRLAPVEPPAPGSPGGLPDDRTPVSEAPFTPDSAQGAGEVLQTYFASVAMGRYDDAYKLWGDGGRASGLSSDAFAQSFADYDSYNAQIGAPGRIEGAAGSLYVDIPVVVYGRRSNGAEVHESGTATLRRVNNVPGATPEQLSWRISSLKLKPSR